MAEAMEAGVGIQRMPAAMEKTAATLRDLRERYGRLHLEDDSVAFNTEWLSAIELGFLLDVAEAMTAAALARRESRGSHQRPEDYPARDDAGFLKHSLAHHGGAAAPTVDWQDVNITRSEPGERLYGGAARAKEAAQ